MAAVVFSYDILPQGEIDQLKTSAARIRRRVRSSAEDTFQIGQELLDARKLFSGDQSFGAWLQYEFQMPRTTAWRFMSVAARYYDSRSSLEHLPITALYELASPSLPQEVRTTVEDRVIVGGEVVTADEIQRLRCAAEEVDDLRDDNGKLSDRVVELNAQLELVAIPSVITVQPNYQENEQNYQAFVSHWRALPMMLRERFWREFYSPIAAPKPQITQTMADPAQWADTIKNWGTGNGSGSH
jgi:hypothetical protein